MASLRTYRNPFFCGKDKLAKAPTKEDSILAISHAPILALAQAFASAPASTLGPPERYIDKDLQKATKLALKLFVKDQKHVQL